MRVDRKLSFRGRFPHAPSHNAVALAKKTTSHGVPLSKRARGNRRDRRLPFAPPENWHEPNPELRGYRIVVQEPGPGFRHVVTPDEVKQRLDALPPEFLDPLEVLQFSRMTRKKQSFPCYGMQWGNSLYLYPIEESLVEHYDRPPRPSQQIEARMYGGRWEHAGGGSWRLIWTERAIKDFYLNNILIHELGHLLDDRNTSSVDRERFAEWFAVRHGYLATAQERRIQQPVRRRHARK
jgi:hypothetical protein